MSTVSNVTNLGTSAVAKKRRSSTSSSSSSSSSNSATSELTSSQPVIGKLNCGSRNNYFDELAELISASIPDMTSSLSSSKPDKSAILQETVNQIRKIKQQECEERNAVQQSDVSSSRPTFLADKLFGPLFLEALDGFVFVVNTDGKILFVSKNVTSVLKYGQDDLMGKIIYDFIYIGDHSRFSGSLLPITFGCSSETSSAGVNANQKSRSFNCRLLIKKSELDESMENKYENMQISAVLLPYPGEKAEATDSDSNVQNCLVCIAHRIPASEGSNNNNVNSPSSEKFTTKLNFSGTILAVDTSGVSAKYSQYLNKDLVGRIIYTLCYAYDHSKLNQHIKEAIQSGNHVSNVYRLMISKEKYLHVQTTTKKFNYNQVTGEQEFLLSTHTIIRESEIESIKPASSHQNSTTISIPSPVSNSQIAGSNNATTSCPPASSSPSVTANSISISTPDTFTSNYSSLSLSQDLNLNDFGIDMFSHSNWGNTLTQSCSSTSIDNSGTSDGLCNSVVSWPASTVSVTSASTSALMTTVSASVPSIVPSPSINSNHSPAPPPSTTPNVSTSTPFSNSFPFSPIQEHADENKVSPMHVTANIGFESSLESATAAAASGGDTKKMDSRMASATPTGDSQVSGTTLKLRDLLTQGMEDSEASSSIVPSSGEQLKSSEQMFFSNPNSMNSKNENLGGNIILRELLNQEEDENTPSDDKNFVQVKIEKTGNTSAAAERSRRASASSSGINTVLRTLLNEDEEAEKGFKRHGGGDRILQNLLKEEATDDKSTSSSVSEGESHRTQSTSSMDETLLKSFGLAPASSSQSVTSNTLPRPAPLHEIVSSHKRHSSDTDGPDTSMPESKRQNMGNASGAGKVHLAGQNPMLASMLAQTPKQTHIVPTSIANALVSEIPQKKLPGDLEKKLVYTPITRTPQDMSHSTTPHNSIAGHDQANFAQRMLRPDINSDVHKDSNHVSGPPSYSAHGQTQGFLSNLLMAPTQTGGLPPRPGSQHSSIGPPNTIAPSASNSQVIPVSGIENIGQSFGNSPASKSTSLNEFLNSSNVTLTDASSSSKTQSSDPVLAEILDAVYNMQQDIDTPITDDSLLTILDEVMDTGGSFPSHSGAMQRANHDLSEKMAISAITKHLMSVEPTAGATQSHTPFSQQPPAYSSSQYAPPTYTQSSSTMGTVAHPPHPAFQPQSAPVGNHAPPNYPNMAQQRPRYQSQQSLPNQIQNQVGQQFHNMSGGNEISNNMPPQVRQALLLQKQKQMRDQQQRLIQQQQHQQIMMRTQQTTHAGDQLSSSSPLSFENMNDLLNNTIAPNVSLQRSTSIPDSQLSPRFSNQQLPSPVPPTSQISPGNQRVNQQSYPGPPPPHPSSQYQRTSPAPQLSPVPGFFPGTTTSSSSQISPNIGAQQNQNTSNNFPNNRSQMSPQPGSTAVSQQSQWSGVQRTNSATLQQQNPMLNAQLSQATFNRQSNRHPSAGSLRSLPSPNTAHSPFSQQDSFPSLHSPVTAPPVTASGNNNVIYQQPQPQARMKRAISVSVPGRVNSPRTPQGQFLATSQDSMMSPQPQMSPSYPQSAPTTPVTQSQANFNVSTPQTPTSAATPSSAPPPYSGASSVRPQSSSDGQFSFDQQNLQMFTGSSTSNGTSQQPSERNRNQNVSSEYVKQEIRTMIGARTQFQAPGTSNSGQQNLSLQQEDLEALGLSLELGQDLAAGGSGMHSTMNRAPSVGVPANSPRMPGDDGRPDQKRSSLLKQLLSE